jgi:protein-S-isoprenylcysteine O-methyltransferase Ste14
VKRFVPKTQPGCQIEYWVCPARKNAPILWSTRKDGAMHLIGEQALGIILVVLFVAQGIVMALPTSASAKQKSEGGVGALLHLIFGIIGTSILTLLFAIFLIIGFTGPIEATQFPVQSNGLLTIIETIGIALILVSYPVIWWGKFSLGRCFAHAAATPLPDNDLVVRGAYRLVRNPIYTAGLMNFIGLALATQSVAFGGLFIMEIVALALLIPIEERQLLKAHGDAYSAYKRQVKRLVPFIY